MTLKSTQIVAAALTATVTVGTMSAAYWYLKTKAQEFVKVARVKKIIIYPIKSIVGIEIPYTHCTVEGPVYDLLKDRSMMIVKGDYFVSQREEPPLSLINLSYDNGRITLTADEMDPLIIDAVDPVAASKPAMAVR